MSFVLEQPRSSRKVGVPPATNHAFCHLVGPWRMYPNCTALELLNAYTYGLLLLCACAENISSNWGRCLDSGLKNLFTSARQTSVRNLACIPGRACIKQTIPLKAVDSKHDRMRKPLKYWSTPRYSPTLFCHSQRSRAPGCNESHVYSFGLQ